MAELSGTPVRKGEPRSPEDAAFLERFDTAFRLPIIISAVLPLIVAPEPGKIVSVVIGIVTWLVFVVDYVVHRRHTYHFGRTAFGRFDLVIVIATAPWFLLPGAYSGGFVVLLRLARLGRIVMASKGSRQLFQRLGRVGTVAAGVLVTASLVAYYAEHPTNPEFATIGDALWWGIVTMTTVGYGDIVPKTPTGRWAAVVIMLTGVAVLGLLAGSLASFFKIGKDGPAEDAASDGGEPVPAADPATALGALVSEVASLRQQVALLSERIADMADPSGHVSPATGADET